MINNAQVFNGDYTDLGFEITDNHVLVGYNDMADEGYNEQETFGYVLHVKYREKDAKKLNIFLDLDNLNLDSFQDTLLKVSISSNDKVIKDNEIINIENKRIYLYEELLEYSLDNYDYNITLNFFSKTDESDIKYSYDIASKLTADLV